MYKIILNIVVGPPGHKPCKLLAMKCLIVLFFLSIAQAGAVSMAQKISLNEKNTPLDKVFEKIRQQSGFDFIITERILNESIPVTINVKGQPLKTVLDHIFSDQPLEYQINSNAILVKLKEKSIIDYIRSAFSKIDVAGRVMDDKGIPIPGATIQMKKAKRAFITDNNGFFSLKNIEENEVLIISAVGFDKQEVPAKAGSLGNIYMKVATSKLDEVQVIAYGTTTQRYNTGSSTKISAEEISSQPVSNPLAALEGRVAGLLITSSTGNPGAGFKVQIRGQNTLGSTPGARTLGDSPYFIVDGIPFAPQNNPINRLQTANDGSNPTGQPSSGLSPFEFIDPSNIESIEVLKDADATSIYGARGANGVILITTKQAKTGKSQLSGNIYTAINTFTRTMPLLNTQQYLQMRRDAFAQDNITPNTTPGSTGFAPELLLFDQNRYTDYLKEFYGKNASSTNGNLSLSGGDFLNSYVANLGFGRQTYMFPGDFAQSRLNGMLKLHHNSINRKFSFDISAEYAYEKNNSPGSPSVLSAFTLPPNFPDLYNADGSLRWDYYGANLSSFISSGMNPWGYLKMTNDIAGNRFATSSLISYEIIPGLKLKANLGFNNLILDEYAKTPRSAQNPTYAPVSTANKSNNAYNSWSVEPQLTYEKQLGRERISLLFGGTLQKNTNRSTSISATNYANELLLGTIAAAGTTSTQENSEIYKYNAFFGRVNFIHNSKYIVNLTGRIDGSSRFAPGREWGKFASAAGAWIISEEDFFKPLKSVMSFAKLRSSYGITGNDNVGNYLFTSNWSPLSSSYLYNGSVGYIPRNLPNPEFSWSVTKKLEIALETGFLQDRILLAASWYRNLSGDQLIQYQLPAQTGFANVTQNFPAIVENRGWEISLTANLLKDSPFSWKASANISLPRNKLAEFPGLESSSYANALVVGQPVSTLRGYKYAGVNPQTGLYQFQTMTGAISSTPSAAAGDNRFVIGNTDPKFFGGLRNTVSYKGFQIDLFLEFRKQKGLSYMSSLNNPTGFQSNVPLEALQVWTKPGDDAKYQRLTTLAFGSPTTLPFIFYKMSDGVLTDASYIRLKTAGLSYSFSSSTLKKLGLAGARVYVNAENLFTITNYLGNDPETQNYYSIPPLRTVSAGVNFNF